MTVLTRTRVEERSSGLDLSQILGDLGAKEAELAVLREVLRQKENQLQVHRVTCHPRCCAAALLCHHGYTTQHPAA